MKAKDLHQKLLEIEANLKAFGELSALVSNGPAALSQVQQAQQIANALVPQLEAEKTKTSEMLAQIEAAKKTLSEQVAEVESKKTEVKQLEAKVQELVEKTNQQLARAADETLANAFEKEKRDLKVERDKWFYYLIGAVFVLLIAIAATAWWQVREVGTLYHWAFPLRIALTSPIIFFVLFVAREFGRARSLIEEYTFKSAIALNFAAYKEILDETFKGQPSDVLKSELMFIIESVRSLYSSPMRNIKSNKGKEKSPSMDLLSSALEHAKGIIPGSSKVE